MLAIPTIKMGGPGPHLGDWEVGAGRIHQQLVRNNVGGGGSIFLHICHRSAELFEKINTTLSSFFLSKREGMTLPLNSGSRGWVKQQRWVS